jgi:hypothetical protein
MLAMDVLAINGDNCVSMLVRSLEITGRHLCGRRRVMGLEKKGRILLTLRDAEDLIGKFARGRLKFARLEPSSAVSLGQTGRSPLRLRPVERFTGR